MDTLATLGLWGDGDEIFAIEDAFAAIAVKVPVEDAPTWTTVGDLWRSVARVSPDTAKSCEAWDRFRQSISEETSVDWKWVAAETKLLDGRGYSIISRLVFSIRAKLRARDA